METSCRMKPISRLPTARSTIGFPVEEQYKHCVYIEEHKEDPLLKSNTSIAGSKKSSANSVGAMSRGSKQD